MAELCVRGIRYRISFGFLAMLAVMCLLGMNPLLYISACAAHEIGHLLCMSALGVMPSCISFSAGGILISPDRTRLLPMLREMLILLSGAGMNFLLGAVFLFFGMYTAAAVQLAVGLWNLLPLSALDGGAILRLVAERLTNSPMLHNGLYIFSGAVMLLLAALCHHYRLSSGLLCAVFVCFGGTELAKGVRM